MYRYFHQEYPDEQTDARFPDWFKSYVCQNNNTIANRHLESLAKGPLNKATSWPIYFVNGYKFHTAEYGHGKKTYNSGVFVRGDSGNGQNDWYGVVTEILELEYVGDNTVVLFNCEWYDPTPRVGTRKHNHYNIVEINHTKRYLAYDPFIIAHNTRQVYYLSYPGRSRSTWKAVIKTKPRGRLEVDGEEETNEAYQVDVAFPSRTVVVDTTDIVHGSGEFDIVEHPNELEDDGVEEPNDDENEEELDGDEVEESDDDENEEELDDDEVEESHDDEVKIILFLILFYMSIGLIAHYY